MTDCKYSILEYYSKEQKSCGYCSSTDGSYSYGLHAHTLKVEDYQEMIDRGWRRCGKYCYKPILDSSCCPLYTIRCAAKEFKVSRTQKKILKRFNNFLVSGTVTKDKIYKNTEIVQPMDVSNLLSDENHQANKDLSNEVNEVNRVDASVDTIINCPETIHVEEKIKKPVEIVSTVVPNSQGDINKKKCMKAKQLRIEKKRQKLKKLGLNEEEISKKLIEKKKFPVVKTIEDFFKEPLSRKPCHNLKISVIRSSPKSEEFINTFAAAFDLYKRYQMFIHKDAPEKLTQNKFERFLVISPLQADKGYGSYHQQYWLDDKLIAVGVIDVLPKCVSSVYFFYDPDYAYLSLGTYGALREVEFTRKLSNRFPDLEYYYMGFYIHSCIKMKYKGSFKPSYLLCPEVYTWHPIQECLPKIETYKYARLNEDPNASDVNSDILVSEVLILYKKVAMTCSYYLKEKRCCGKEKEEIIEYAKLIGKTCAKRILLFRSDE